MQRRIFSISIAVASAAAFALAPVSCGGPRINVEQLANQPGMHRTSAVTVSQGGKDLLVLPDPNAGGMDVAQPYAQYDASSRTLTLVYTDDMSPDSRCRSSGLADSTAFQWVVLRIHDYDLPKTGTFPVAEAEVVDKNKNVNEKLTLDGTTIVISQVDSDRLVAKVDSTSSAKTTVTGHFDADPCYADDAGSGAASGDASAPEPASASSSSSDVTDAGAAATDASTPATGKTKKKKKKKKSGG